MLFFFFSSRRRHTRCALVLEFRRVLFRSYIAIVNYCVIAILQLELGENEEQGEEEIGIETLEKKYGETVDETRDLMLAKNHDYGEAWRGMRISSLTDLILMKILRVKQIENNKGNTLASEGVKANYQDMLNYAVFALIRLTPKKSTSK